MTGTAPFHVKRGQLLPNAEPAEDSAQDILGIDPTCQTSDFGCRLTQILSADLWEAFVGREIPLQGRNRAFQVRSMALSRRRWPSTTLDSLLGTVSEHLRQR